MAEPPGRSFCDGLFRVETNAAMGGDGDGDGNWTIAGVWVPFWTCISELVR